MFKNDYFFCNTYFKVFDEFIMTWNHESNKHIELEAHLLYALELKTKLLKELCLFYFINHSADFENLLLTCKILQEIQCCL